MAIPFITFPLGTILSALVPGAVRYGSALSYWSKLAEGMFLPSPPPLPANSDLDQYNVKTSA